jgi:hypothetical protein
MSKKRLLYLTLQTTYRIPVLKYIKVSDKAVIANLKAHGIKIETLSNETSLNVESFKIKSLKGADRLNQGHYTNSINVEMVTESITFPEGTIIVRTNQTLANVLIYLLEPESGEGFAYWNFFDKYLVPQWSHTFYDYPVYRINDKIEIKTDNY